MLKGRRTRKAVAATLLLVFTVNTFAPTAAYALTSGPTAPEATSFEPVDTTDMVNMQTGDFTYNMPLLEIPGPEGGYPLSLSYHAGIQPNEDASWVGLGWTLNPGAINRFVNGYADDWYSPTGTSHVYWEGGVTKTFSIGVSAGLAQPAGNVNFGLSFSSDTYRGFAVGFSMGIGAGIGGSDSPFGFSIGMGTDGYGNSYVSGGLDIGTRIGKSDLGTSLGINVSTNFKSLNAGVNGGIGYSIPQTGDRPNVKGSLLDASISTGGNKPSLEVGGLSASVSSSKEAALQTKTTGLGATIPTPWGFSISLGYRKTRYWTDETTTTTLHGGLYSSGWGEDATYKNVYDNVAYDNYSLLEDPAYKNIIDNADPQKVQGGAYPDFDLYSVSAQGLGGDMRPYLFEGEVLGQNKKDQNNNQLVTYYSPGVTNYGPQFRFIGDFSNSYRQNYPDYSDPTLNLRIIAPPFDASPVYGNSDGNFGCAGGNSLAGSRHIDVGVKVQPSNISGYTKTDRYQANMIDGFSITNESGVTYHYGLPAYAWGEENYQERIDRSNGLYANRSTKPAAYAYTWYLTTITGPDFVDRDGDGKAGNNDWGYWVNFEYGKWSNSYVWRNPSEGFHRDEDNEWQDCSMGKKEVYYLDAIRTRSHLAIFEKEIRNDAWGASPEIFNKNSDKDYNNAGVFNTNGSKSLRLSHIYLLKNGDNFPSKGLGTDTYVPYSRTIACSDCEMPENVYDKSDVDNTTPYSQYIDGRSYTEAGAIRIIDFNYDYSLCQGVSNNFFSAYNGNGNGKLTLKSVQFRGKRGASLLPPTLFEYDLTGSEIKSQSGVSLSTTSFSTTNGNFEVGDMIREDGQSIYCGVITAKSQAGATYTYTLANSNFTTAGTFTKNIYTTKNPSYNKDAYDMWGMYKSDFNINVATGGNAPAAFGRENLARIVSVNSSKNVDAWSLRQVQTTLGGIIKVDYESDDYSKCALNNNYSFEIVKFDDILNFFYGPIPSGAASGNLKLNIETKGQNLQDYFTAGSQVNFTFFKWTTRPWSPIAPYESCQKFFTKYYVEYQPVDTRDLPNPTTIVQVGSDYVIVNNPAFQSYYQYATQALTNDPSCVLTHVPIRGHLSVSNRPMLFGGGLRVKALRTKDPQTNQIVSAIFTYTKPSNSSVSSGITTYEPCVMEQAIFPDFNNDDVDMTADEKNAYKKILYKDVQNLLVTSREVPPPGVMYEYAAVTTQIKNADEEETRQIAGKTQYQFEVFRNNMIGRVDIGARNDNTNAWGHFTTHNLAFKKFTSCIGNIKSMVQFDKDGRKLSETINHYLHDGLENLPLVDFMNQYKTRLAQFSYQGYLQERYAEVKVVNEQGYNTNSLVMATESAREVYPCIATGQTKINYVNGTQTSSENLAYDFYSGALTKTVETDAYGNRFMTETKPAYRVAEYSNMGLKINTSSNKNMLTQTAATYVYKVNSTNTKLGIVSAQVQTWNNSISALGIDGSSYQQNGPFGAYGDVWRMQSSYSWLPDTKTTDGLTTVANFSDFNFTTPSSSNAAWKKTGEITLYDVFSHSLEAKDMYSNYATSRMDYGNKKVVLSGSPANYYEIAYSGAEDDAISQTGDAFVKKGDGVAFYGIAHTGAQSLKVDHGNKGLIYSLNTNKLTVGRDYMASVWVRPPGNNAQDVKLYYKVNNVEKDVSISSANSTKTADKWNLISLLIKGTDITSNATLEVGCRNDHASAFVYLDDFRFQPLNATTTAYVYDGSWGELSYILDNNNLYTRYAYDAAGRLADTYKEKLNTGAFKVAEMQYNNSQVYGNNFLSGYFQKSNCPGIIPGEEASYVPVIVDQGQITSLISQEDADAQALAYAQKLADNNGTCWVPTVYARLEIYDQGSGSSSTSQADSYDQYVELWIKFYSDAACSQPLTLTSNLDFSYNDMGTSVDQYENVTTSYQVIGGTALAGTNGYMLTDMTSLYGLFIEYDENHDYISFEKWMWFWSLNPIGTNYSIQPTNNTVGYPPAWL